MLVVLVVGLVGFVWSAPLTLEPASNETSVHPAVWVVGGLLALVFAFGLVTVVRDSRRFLRLADAVTTTLLVLLVAGLCFTAARFVAGVDGPGIGSSSLFVESGRIEVEVETGTNFGAYDATDEREWLTSRFGDGAVFIGSPGVRVEADAPTMEAVALSSLALALRFGAMLVGLFFLRGLVRRAADGQPFHVANGRALRVIAWATLAGWFGISIVEHAAARAVIDAAGGTGSASTRLDLHLGTLMLGLVFAALAEVWRYGIALQREAEATV